MAYPAKKVATYEDETFRLIGAHKNDDRVRAPPFDTFELELGVLWER